MPLVSLVAPEITNVAYVAYVAKQPQMADAIVAVVCPCKPASPDGLRPMTLCSSSHTRITPAPSPPSVRSFLSFGLV